MHLILTGATGLVGSGVLQQMLANESITTISILSRRPVPMTEGHQKAKVIIHKDFKSYPSDVLDQLKGASGCVWALGISQTEVSKEMYEEITYDYTIAAARAFSALSDPFVFVYVSGEGASTNPPSRFTPIFSRVKGKTESALLELSKDPAYSSFEPYSVRPAGVDAKFHQEIHPFIPKLKPAYKALTMGPLLAAVRLMAPSMISPTKELGAVLTQLAMSDGKPMTGEGMSGEGRTLSNLRLRKMAGI